MRVLGFVAISMATLAGTGAGLASARPHPFRDDPPVSPAPLQLAKNDKHKWKEGGEKYEGKSGGCKYKYKADRKGTKEEYKCK